MFYLGVPVVENYELTGQLLDSLQETVVDPEAIHVVIIDNGSRAPYDEHWEKRYSFRVSRIRYEENKGYYYPILDLAKFATYADTLGLCHNDLIFYERGWDRRLRDAYVKEGRLGMVGFCGSNEVDDRGGRGGGTMCNFRGERGARTEHTGRRVTGLEPALIFDSLFLSFRYPVLSCLKVDEDIALNHFGDRVWPLRAIENEWRVGVLGVEIDHRSGSTLVGLARIDEDSRIWCERHNVAIPEGMQAGTAVYLESERRYLTEYRDQKHMIPARMRGWEIHPLQLVNGTMWIDPRA